MTLRDQLSLAFDSLVEAVSPRLGAARMEARRVLARERDKERQRAEMARAASSRFNPQNSSLYDGASSDNLHGNGWLTSRLSADVSLEEGLTQEELRLRSRDMYRNTDIGGAVDARVDLVVGTGFTLQSKIKPTRGFATPQQARDWNARIEEISEEWSRAADVDGRTSLWENSRLVERHHAFDGESFTVWSDVSDAGKPIPLAIEVIDPDRVQTPPGKFSDPLCRMGVQRNKQGRIDGYWIQRKHPGETRDPDLQFDFVPSHRVLHVFEKWFAGQSRGLPWMTRALTRILDGKDLDEAGIIAAQVEACYVGFIKKAPNNGLGPQAVVNAEATYTSASGNRQKNMTPGTIRVLDSGEEIQFGVPPHGNQTVPHLQEMNYRRIAGALNVAYEMLARDWRGVSFAGGRLILSGVKLDTKSRQRRLCDSWFTPLHHRVVEESVIVGAIDIDPDQFRRRPLLYQRHKWVPQAWPYSIKPGEEVDAALKAVNGNLRSKADVAAEMFGGDFEEVASDRAFERGLERDNDIVPPDVAQHDQPQQEVVAE